MREGSLNVVQPSRAGEIDRTLHSEAVPTARDRSLRYMY